MAFLEPAGLWLLAFLPPVMLLYMLKLRRDRRAVSSTLLWRRVCLDAQANTLWQRLRRHLLLLLQLLVITLLAIAFARPYLPAGTVFGRDILLIVDNSASMRTREGDATRLHLATAKARQLIAGIGPQDNVTLMVTAPQPRLLLSNADNERELSAALRAIVPAGRGDRSGALLLAQQLLAHAPERYAYLLSDGDGETEPLGIPAPARMTWLPIGTPHANLSVTAADLRQQRPGAPAELMAAAANVSGVPAAAMLRVYVNGDLVEARELHLAPRERQAAVFTLPAPAGAAAVQVELDPPDALPEDNSAYLLLQPAQPLRVVYVGRYDAITARALQRWPGIAYANVHPSVPLAPRAFDLAIWEKDGPPADLPGAHCIFAPRPGAFGAGDSPARQPQVVAWDRVSGPFARCNLTRLFIAESRRLEIPAVGRVLVRGAQGPLAVERSDNGQHSIVCGFALSASDFPYRVAFPVFLADLMTWARGHDPRAVLAWPPAARWSNPTDYGTAVVRPDGSSAPLDDGTTAATELAGFYRLQETGEPVFAVSLHSEQDAELYVAPAPADGAAAGAPRREALTEMWPFFILLACLTLLAEWWIYHRRLFTV